MDIAYKTTTALTRPVDPYDPLWVEYNRQNPHLPRGIGSGVPGEAPDPNPAPKGEENPVTPPAKPAETPPTKPEEKPGSVTTTPSVDELLATVKKLEDEKAGLVKDAMKKKERAKTAEEQLATLQSQLGDTLGEMTLEDVKKALEDRKAAEEAKLKAEGDFEALRARLIAEHSKERDKINGTYGAQVKELTSKLESAESEIRRLLVTNSFAGSNFLKDELILTPSKAEKLFGENFKVEEKNGQRFVVAYLGGEPLVDGNGVHLSFEEAFKEIVNRDPERETIIRPKAKPGAGSGAEGKGKLELPQKPTRGVSAIQSALEKKGK